MQQSPDASLGLRMSEKNAMPAAASGYEGFLNPREGRMRRSAIKKDDRLFSNSSATGSRHLADAPPTESTPDHDQTDEMGEGLQEVQM